MIPRVLVIGGGQNAEHEVSRASATAVAAALRERYRVSQLTIRRDGVWCDDSGPLAPGVARSLSVAVSRIGDVDVVFPAVHGVLGEDGTLAALCALAGTTLVGSSLGAGAVGMDKWVTKVVAEAIGMRTAPGRIIHARDIAAITFERPVVVKPVASGSSYGVTLAEDAAGLAEALRVAANFDSRILVEEPIHAREVDVAVLRDADGACWVAPALEIHASGVFDTDTKYDGSARFSVPADLTERELSALQRDALRIFDALGCAGVARVDFFLTAEGPVLNEINTLPGLSPASQVPRMFAAAGVSYAELTARLVRAALASGTPQRQSGTPQSAALMSHLRNE
ncbi:ATP-grasp domain-containing protein [Leucobacter luti]|uniref:ATP-grasp domain-containing protein n=1 Tax=Leucobacter luti TaxID=340320 RepID=UPI001C689614|nr:ATP-grasp domain-containing protein [Leucobacter luti]QYM75936.1 ATP-grasp domain-containing protein [Leucobacter luti]